MKTLKKTNIFAFIISAILFSCKEKSPSNTESNIEPAKAETIELEESEISFVSTDAEKVFRSYVEISKSLIESDAKSVRKAALGFQTLEIAELEKISEVTLLISSSDDLESQRRLFSELTTLIEPVIKNQMAGGKVYKQYCPMAFNNEGASWLSQESAIRNPYFGSKMLKCGKITETFTQ